MPRKPQDWLTDRTDEFHGNGRSLIEMNAKGPKYSKQEISYRIEKLAMKMKDKKIKHEPLK